MCLFSSVFSFIFFPSFILRLCYFSFFPLRSLVSYFLFLLPLVRSSVYICLFYCFTSLPWFLIFFYLRWFCLCFHVFFFSLCFRFTAILSFVFPLSLFCSVVVIVFFILFIILLFAFVSFFFSSFLRSVVVVFSFFSSYISSFLCRVSLSSSSYFGILFFFFSFSLSPSFLPSFFFRSLFLFLLSLVIPPHLSPLPPSLLRLNFLSRRPRVSHARICPLLPALFPTTPTFRLLARRGIMQEGEGGGGSVWSGCVMRGGRYWVEKCVWKCVHVACVRVVMHIRFSHALTYPPSPTAA